MDTVPAHGAAIPALGFGTFRMSGPDVLRMVPQVLKLGYRHIDTAQVYGNEAEVGQAVKTCGLARGEVFDYRPRSGSIIFTARPFRPRWMKA